MATVKRDELLAYLAETLPEPDMRRIEKLVRDSADLQEQLRLLITQRDQGEHSLGAIWQRERLSCPTREQLGSYLLETLEPAFHAYIHFHLEVIACPACLANRDDLLSRQYEPAELVAKRRKRVFDKSLSFLQVAKQGGS